MHLLKSAAAAFCLIPLLLRADEPAWKSTLSDPALGPYPKLAPCRLEYRASWKGLIDAATMQMEFGNPANAKPGIFVVTSSSQSLGAAAALFPYKHWFWSELDATTLKPKLFHSVEELEDKRVNHSLDYNPTGVHCSQTTKVTKTGAEYTNTKDFAFAPVFDIFSAMLFIRSQELTDDSRYIFVIQPGETPYLANVRVVGREVHEGKNSIRLSVGMQKISTKTMGLKPYKKMKNASLWLSDDEDRVPLEIRVAAYVGDVRLILSKTTKL
jgi:hypothetical protein